MFSGQLGAGLVCFKRPDLLGLGTYGKDVIDSFALLATAQHKKT